jgi:opacity protein-like surface antigen
MRAEVEVSGHWHDVDGTVYPFDTVEGDADAMFALANLWIDLPLSEIVRPYFGGGVGLGRLDLDIEWTNGDTAFDDSDWGFAYQLGAGVALNITDNIALDFGYRYKVINNAEVEMEQNGEDVEVDYQSYNFIAGIRLEM